MESRLQPARDCNNDYMRSDVRMCVWEEIVYFSRVKTEWFRENIDLKLENGVASHDTFQRVFQSLYP